MTEQEHGEHPVCDEDEDEKPLNYKPPAQKSLAEIVQLDPEDESLAKYKKTLLGEGLPLVEDPNAPNVVVTRMTLICEEAPEPITMDLTGDLKALKNTKFVLKEGVSYKVKIHFKVNKDIVSGLKYVATTFRKGIKVDKVVCMVGSYGPRADEYEFVSTPEEAPKGIAARGTYTVKSNFTDDDKSDHLSWEWLLSLKKEWKE
ncbi:rho GDP-dissociation inhibitor 2-like isoform X2 [Carcharodon carcharias]|nr:rho GDP-dissociation inhibitor 2-like isoform X2 [Carcharodon carcharias]XP_041033908.1 rho GDP-dissociation inhibitor 2-like isoform X2 [Carcharodon carcharias]XP_041033909.1 rho GDP-dissociation inhibitor 2-like isoform X2 [Carcharodon carcharias]